MVKIRLRRLGNKGRPFYRVIVAEAAAGRSGSFVETIGLYDPIAQPKRLELKEDRALHWLLAGAQPTETAAVILNRAGVLEKFFAERPNLKAKYKFLDKRTPATKAEVAEPAPVE